jgi:5-methylcytosine-specific restriction endonuclease McrA
MSDPKNLIFLCRDCHVNKGGSEWKKKAEEIVLSFLK